MTQLYMRDKTGKDTQVKFGKKRFTKPKKKVYNNPVRSPQILPEPRPNNEFAKSNVSDAVKLTEKRKKEGKNYIKKGSVVQKSKKSEGVAVGKVYDPEARLKAYLNKKKLQEEKKKKNQMTAHQKRKDELRNMGKSKISASSKAKSYDAVFKTISGKPKKLKT